METNEILGHLRRELGDTFSFTPRYKAILIAMEVVKESDKAKKIMERLLCEYFDQIVKHMHEIKSGDTVGASQRRQIIEILGGILGKSKEEIERELWAK
ncbi:MAG: hypothetical protein IKR28_09205 [Selenomonadaceae bacterium]|nr:hypothetical protein [Selenomonadaceae bacterium]